MNASAEARCCPIRAFFRSAAVGVVASALVCLGACSRVDHPQSGDEPPAPSGLEIITTATGFEMVLVPAGRFEIGNARGQADEQPPHEVELDAFFIDRYEVTQAQWDKLVRGNPSHFKGPGRPVEMISWSEAALFCNERSRAEGLTPCYDEETAQCRFEADGYRLPTEAEWEYACRAGCGDDYYFGSDPNELKQHAWYKDNAGKTTHPVGQKKSNAWGLYDMHGNVAEWCNDIYAEDYYASSPAENPRGPEEGEKYVLRSGAWNTSPDGCRASHRVGEDPGFQDACFARDAIGFRCVRRADAVDPAESPETDSPNEEDSSADLAEGARTGFLWDPGYLKHDTGPNHPENPRRLESILAKVEAEGLLPRLHRIDPRPAEERWLTAIHRPDYLARLERLCREGPGFADSADTPVSPQSYDVAVLAAGGVLAAVDAVIEGKVANAFCAVRPPGHHALPDRAMGFCLLNNAAIAARYVQQRHKLPKVLVVDWDVHHGNGTQDVFYEDPTVFYFSVHQYPFYPGSGAATETGGGAGAGTTLNVPLPAGSGDREYLDAFDEKLLPAAIEFDPDFILVSAGFDAHEDDLLGRMKVTANGFAAMTRRVVDLADRTAGGRLVSVLEGGYGLDGLAECVAAHLRALMTVNKPR